MPCNPERTLAGIALLKGLSAAELSRVGKTCAWKHVAAGEVILNQEDGGTDVLFVVAGRLQVRVYSASGQQVIFGEVAAGETFGEFAAIDGMPRSASVVARADSMVASISADAFWSLIHDHAVVRTAMLKRLVTIVRDVNDRLFQVATLKAQDRIRVHLLRLATEAGVCGNQATIQPIPVQSDVADKLMTHREAVSREMSALTRDGILRRQGETLLVLDVLRLRDLTEADL